MGGTISDYRSENVFIWRARAGEDVARSLGKRNAGSHRRPDRGRSAYDRASRHRDIGIEASHGALFAVRFGNSDSTSAAYQRPPAARRAGGIQRREPGATGKADRDQSSLGRL